MDVALIPPKGYEGEINRTKVQMMLPHVVHAEYMHAYSASQLRGDLIILDNGAAELANSFTAKQLVVKAIKAGATELVAADHLYAAGKTINAVKWFCTTLERMDSALVAQLKYVAVTQGKSLDDAKKCVQAFAEQSRITTLGLPRLLVTQEHRAIRIDLANWIEDNYPNRFVLHLLGTSSKWPKEVQLAMRYAPHIRSVDTSLPFNYAIAGERLDLKNPRTMITRPSGYFDNPPPMNPLLLRRNIETLLGWANAEASTSRM